MKVRSGERREPAMGRNQPSTSGWLLGVHRVASQKSFVYFWSAAIAVFGICDLPAPLQTLASKK